MIDVVPATWLAEIANSGDNWGIVNISSSLTGIQQLRIRIKTKERKWSCKSHNENPILSAALIENDDPQNTSMSSFLTKLRIRLC